MKLFIEKLITLWVQIRDIYLYMFRHAIIVNGYVDDHTWHGIQHRNWGDDLNYYFLNELTGRPVVFYHNFKLAKWLHLKNFLCIGTLLDGRLYKNDKTIIWGSGYSGADRGLSCPKQVLSVRGPLSREYLCEQKVPCPEQFGDPALLLPLVYQPNQTSMYRLGIIPHVVDLHHSVIEEIRKEYADEIIIIDLAHYDKWTDVIDQICSCERILSSSLHGIIVSDAYQVPNRWIELTGKVSGGHFKYLDYASSVDRQFDKPIQIDKNTEITNIPDCVFSYAHSERIKELQQGLLAVAPFKCKIGVETIET